MVTCSHPKWQMACVIMLLSVPYNVTFLYAEVLRNVSGLGMCQNLTRHTSVFSSTREKKKLYKNDIKSFP